MQDSPVAALRFHITALTERRDLAPVADALSDGSSAFHDAPDSLLDLWNISSELYAWETRLAQGPLTPEETTRLLEHMNAGWQGVAALIAGGLTPD